MLTHKLSTHWRENGKENEKLAERGKEKMRAMG